MPDEIAIPGMSLPDVVNGAVGPSDPYCMGYMNPGSSGLGYISTLKLSTGIVSMKGLDAGTEGIVSYDRCEKNDAYIGQINMLTASSFCGVNGAVWGYHLAVADEIANGTLQPMYSQQEPGGKEIPVYQVQPLLTLRDAAFWYRRAAAISADAGRARNLRQQKRDDRGPHVGMGAAGAGHCGGSQYGRQSFYRRRRQLWGSLDAVARRAGLSGADDARSVTKSMIMCGVDQNVSYSKIFAGYVFQFAPADHVGCALTCAPYVLLARKAIPIGGPASILNMTISKWETAVGLPPLPEWRRDHGEASHSISAD